MSNLSVTLTANAGTIIQADGHIILIDALHEEKCAEFSTLSQEDLSALFQFFSYHPPELYITTHFHGDHYSQRLVDLARGSWKDCSFLFPAWCQHPYPVFCRNGVNAEMFPLPHEGKQYQGVLNCGYFLCCGDYHILTLGDCSISAEGAIKKLIAGRPVDLALLNFSWVCLPEARKIVTRVIAPSAVAVIHLPFEKDDVAGYRQVTRQCVASLTEQGIDVQILDSYMQRAIFHKRLIGPAAQAAIKNPRK